MPVSDDTDRSEAVRLVHLSPTWVRQLDALAGQKVQENGGYFEVMARFEGKARPKWYDIVQRFLMHKGNA